MKSRTYFAVSSFLFTVVAIIHLLRLINGWRVQVGSVLIPVWVSWIGLLVLGFLAYSGYRLCARNK